MNNPITLSSKTLEKLIELINDDSNHVEYRSGSMLVSFFNALGYFDTYEDKLDGLSRKQYTTKKLEEINGTHQMNQCLCNLFNPVNYIERMPLHIRQLSLINEYLEFDDFILIRKNKHIEVIQIHSNSPLDKEIVFNIKHIQSHWKKAIERKSSDPEGAITMARTLIESLLKQILNEQEIDYNENTELSELYKLVAKYLNLQPEQHHEIIFKQVLGGASGIINGIGTIRNKLGDAHGSTGLKVKPKERHSELVVNLAGTMAIFLYKTYKEKVEA